jgi:group I intron endonuclease
MTNYVYITTNLINGKKYIGDRSYIGNIKNDNYLGSGIKIKEDLKKFGKENFQKEILEIFPTRIESHKAESKYIKLFKTHISEGGYNINLDGGTRNGGKHSEETKEKISKSHKGIGIGLKRSGETKIKMAKLLIGNTNGLGKKRSAESIKKYKKSKLGNKNPMYGKCGIQTPRFDFSIYKFINTISGEIFIGYKSDLARQLNTIGSSIKRIIDGKRTHYKGWVFDKMIY